MRKPSQRGLLPPPGHRVLFRWDGWQAFEDLFLFLDLLCDGEGTACGFELYEVLGLHPQTTGPKADILYIRTSSV